MDHSSLGMQVMHAVDDLGAEVLLEAPREGTHFRERRVYNVKERWALERYNHVCVPLIRCPRTELEFTHTLLGCDESDHASRLGGVWVEMVIHTSLDSQLGNTGRLCLDL